MSIVFIDLEVLTNRLTSNDMLKVFDQLNVPKSGVVEWGQFCSHLNDYNKTKSHEARNFMMESDAQNYTKYLEKIIATIKSWVESGDVYKFYIRVKSYDDKRLNAEYHNITSKRRNATKLKFKAPSVLPPKISRDLAGKVIPAECRVIEAYKNRPLPPYDATSCATLILNGNDGEVYVSKLYKNVYEWIKTKNMDETRSPFEYFGQFRDVPVKYDVSLLTPIFVKLKKDFEHLGIFFTVVEWNKCYNFVDDMVTELDHRMENNGLNFMEDKFICTSDHRIFNAATSTDGYLYFLHKLDKTDTKNVKKTLLKYFDQANVPNDRDHEIYVKLDKAK